MSTTAVKLQRRTKVPLLHQLHMVSTRGKKLQISHVLKSLLILLGEIMKLNLFICFSSLLWCLLDHGVSGVDTERVSVMEGDSVTLHTGVQTNHQDRIRWYFNAIRIAQINGDQSKACTDVQCKDGDERFRDRLKLDHQTGSLTIMNTRNTDSGQYQLKISSGSSESEKTFNVTIRGGVFVMEEDSVTLNTGVQTNNQDRIRWYFNDTRIAQINGDQIKSCTDVQCNEGTERFRDRLKLDHQTGSLTIMNTRNTDSGDYVLKIISSGSSDSEQIFSVTVQGVPATERNKMKSVEEGESVTFDPGVGRKPNDLMWYFKDTLIAEITRDLSKICTDVQCDERFRDRLKLDHQTGSLIIMNTRKTDSGNYTLKIISSRFSITRSFSVSVTAVPGSGLSPAAVIGIVVAVVLLLLVAVGLIYYRHWRSRRQGTWTAGDDQGNIEVAF